MNQNGYYKSLSKKLIKSKNSNKPSQNKTEVILLKDILIPLLTSLFSALMAVGINQFFFKSNRRIEAELEYQKEILKTQTPILNRILAFTNRYKVTTLYYVKADAKIETRDCVNISNGEVLSSTKDTILYYGDTVNIEAPSFVIDSVERVRLYNDLESMQKNRDLLDSDIYIAFEDILDFLYKNQLPALEQITQNDLRVLTSKTINKIEKSGWCNKKNQDKWTSLLVNLGQLCDDRILILKNF